MDNFAENEIAKQKEDADKLLLKLEIVLGKLSCLFWFAMIFIAAFVQMQDWIRALLIIVGFIFFMVGVLFAIKIEQVAGYYECAKCDNKYIPTYKSVFWSPHVGRTRYMKCPRCNGRSWQKKVISNERIGSKKSR